MEIAESHHAADLLAEGAAPGLRRRRAHARRPRPDHRDRERHRRALRAAGGLRPHRFPAARARRRRAPARRARSTSRAARSSRARARKLLPGERLVVMTPGGGGLGAPDARRGPREHDCARSAPHGLADSADVDCIGMRFRCGNAECRGHLNHGIGIAAVQCSTVGAVPFLFTLPTAYRRNGARAL